VGYCQHRADIAPCDLPTGPLKSVNPKTHQPIKEARLQMFNIQTLCWFFIFLICSFLITALRKKHPVLSTYYSKRRSLLQNDLLYKMRRKNNNNKNNNHALSEPMANGLMT
jgi:hypothetical protein